MIHEHRIWSRRPWAIAICVIALPLGTARSEDLVVNGSFDEGVANWVRNSDLIEYTWDSFDAAGSSSSGSALVTSTEEWLRVAVGITQCMNLPSATFYHFAGEIYRPSGQSEDARVGFGVEWRTGTCSDGSRHLIVFPENAKEVDTWEPIEASFERPEAAGSAVIHAWINFAAKNEPTGAYQAYFDNIEFVPEPSVGMQYLAASLTLLAFAWYRRGRAVGARN